MDAIIDKMQEQLIRDNEEGDPAYFHTLILPYRPERLTKLVVSEIE